jgi:hypothetical protein
MSGVPRVFVEVAGVLPMDSRPDDFCFAAVGDVHGHMNRMVRCVQEKAARARRVPAFVLQVGVVETHGLQVVGLSGIHREERFQSPRPALSLLGRVPPKDFISFTEQEVEWALAFERADLLLLHDWPAGIIDPADAEDFEHQRRSPSHEALATRTRGCSWMRCGPDWCSADTCTSPIAAW